MRGDFSRDTFRRLKHYQAVLMQQGRVQLDADWNEQQEIHRHRAESAAAGIIGAVGGPKDDAGFGIQAAGADLVIGKGAYYIDGILCENEAPVSIRAQDDLPGYDPAPVNGATYLAYLEVWCRHVTPIEDPSMRETALGGADTATRSKTVQQVRLLQVNAAAVATPISRTTVFPEWTNLLQQRGVDAAGRGGMAAKADAESLQPTPCTIPPTAGYRRLENQLYRVEIHRGGGRAEARLKWSRDNGCVVAAVEAVSGSELTLHDLGRDDVLGFHAGQWVEISDERSELDRQHGSLVRIERVDPAKRTIEVSGNLPPIDLGRRPTVRRWDQSGSTATADGVATTADWMALEAGVSVRFSEGNYQAGDYWLIPARTAISAETGTIDWPSAGGEPASQPAHGTAHHFAPLAVVQFQGGQFSLVAECRSLFPALTALDAVDVACHSELLPEATNVLEALELLARRGGEGCTLTITPEDDLAAAFATIAPQEDALVCFSAGTYTLNTAVRIADKGHLVLHGCGRGTRFVASSDETALFFENCKSVCISDCAVETRVSRSGSGGDLNGCLTFQAVPIVEVNGVSARCAAADGRHSSCLTVRNDAPGGSVRIRGCDLAIGDQQIGILVVNGNRVHVEDNELAVVPHAGPPPATRGVATARNLARLAMSHGAPAGTKPAAQANAKVVYNGQEVRFATDPALVGEWQAYINLAKPAGITTPRLLQKWLRDAAQKLFTRGFDVQSVPLSMRKALRLITVGASAAAQQGIVVAGAGAREVRILNNSLRGVVQGIHIGVSHKEASRGAADRVDMLLISGNAVAVALSSAATRERHAIFAGNCNSAVIEDNLLTLTREKSTEKLRIEAVRLFGAFDRRVIVRQNHMSGFNVGVRFSPKQLLASQLWLLTENIAVGANPVIDATAVVKARVLGLANNFT